MTPRAAPPAIGRRSLAALLPLALGACVGALGGDGTLGDAEEALARGRAALAAGDADIAAEWFGRAAQLDPGDAVAHSLLGETLYRLGRLNQAEEPLRRAVELDATLAPAWNNLGLLLLARGRTVEAVRALEIAFSLDSGATDAIRSNLATAMAARESGAYDPTPSRTVVPVAVPTGTTRTPRP